MLRPFTILEPETVAQASDLLHQYGSDAAIYAGGTELLVLMKEGLVHYPYLVNLKTVPDLARIALTADGSSLAIGALATHRQIKRAPVVRQRAPWLAQVETHVANLRVRAAGTLGGNLCFAEPHSDPGTLIVATGATLTLSGREGRRQVAADAFFVDLFTVDRQPEEVLVDVILPLLPAQAAVGYARFAVYERPTASVAAVLWMEGGTIQQARLSVGCVGPVPTRARLAEALLSGVQPSEAAFAEAARQMAAEVDVVGDIYGSVAYKRNLVRTLGVRALQDAVARVDGGKHDDG